MHGNGAVSNSSTLYVLDSYALLAYFAGEDGAEAVRSILEAASRDEYRVIMSMINLGEIAYITERERGLARAQEVLAVIDQLPVQIVQADRQSVLAAAHVKAEHPVAYADAFAIAAAQANDGVLVTGDPEFEAVEDRVRILWIGEQEHAG